MKTIRFLCLTIGIIVTTGVFLLSCQKNLSSNVPGGNQRVKIYLTDGPINYDAVFVDIQQVAVQVIPDSCLGKTEADHHDWDDNHDDWCDDNEYRCSVWDTLSIRPGVYNLLNLSNGVDTILANGITISGRINKIRLTLGTHNSVVIDSVSYPLTLWNNTHSVIIKVKGSDVSPVNPNDLQLWLDFDAGSSIVKISDNKFVLRPVIKLFIPSTTASIKGFVLPRMAEVVVAAISNGDTLVAIPHDDNGFFKIRGLKGTSADLFINATANGYRDTTITGVPLTQGRETDVGTIRLHQ